MPKGVYPKTEEHKEKLRQSQLGRHPSLETREKRRQFRLGKHHSIETLEKMRQSKLGRQFTLESKKRMRQAHLGKHHSPETLAKLGLKKENHPNWRGGVSYEPYPLEFDSQLKQRIRERDNYICQLCSIPEDECRWALDIHHTNYDKQNTSEDNLISLCKSCNSRVNHNRELWLEYFLQRKKTALKRKE